MRDAPIFGKRRHPTGLPVTVCSDRRFDERLMWDVPISGERGHPTDLPATVCSGRRFDEKLMWDVPINDVSKRRFDVFDALAAATQPDEAHRGQRHRRIDFEFVIQFAVALFVVRS